MIAFFPVAVGHIVSYVVPHVPYPLSLPAAHVMGIDLL
jgi:hypothetical protein